jgi:hypothetical protein
MTDLRTEEEIKADVATHLSSWDICEALSAQESLNEQEQEKFDRNKNHIQIMLTVDWFVKGCTEEELEKFKKYS